MSDLVLKQGLLSVANHRFEGKILSVVYQAEDETCTVLHSRGTTVFVRGEKGLNIEQEVKESKLLYASQYNLFVAVRTNSIALLADNFCSFYETESKEPIIKLVCLSLLYI